MKEEIPYKEIFLIEFIENNKNFNKLNISTFIKNLNKCNQEYENICIPKILKIIKSEINCKILITDRLYYSLLKDENINNLVKLNFNKINEIHYYILIQKIRL